MPILKTLILTPFFPQEARLSYITFKGFTVMNVACHWAPLSVFQPAAVGPNGGHDWIIEDNIIIYAKSAAISIGIPSGCFFLCLCLKHQI